MKALLRWRRALADRALRRRPRGATLVTVVRDEGPYLVEWLAHHLAVGFDRIVVYDNESRDGTHALFKAITASDLRIRRIPWPTPADVSVRFLAHHHAWTTLVTPWVMSLDPDEFLVPFGYADVAALIGSLPESVASLHVNRRDFAGRAGPGEGLVTRVAGCAPYGWGDHYRFRTLARADRILAVEEHDVRSSHGRRVLSDGLTFDTIAEHTADRVVFEGVQVNHYDRAAPPPRVPFGEASAAWGGSEVHRMEDHAIGAFAVAFEAEYRRLRGILGRSALSG